ncbi:MAG TPA: hypothetical protein VGJ26_05760 [Pirellulales bacterium]|jgi:hypothetical protein
MTKLRSVAAIGLAIIGQLAITHLAFAAELPFTIDPAQSHITLSIQAEDGTPLSFPQTPGSDTTSLSGMANVDVTSSSIQFLSTNDTHFDLQAVPQAPLLDGSAGSSPAQFGLSISIGEAVTGVVAARNYLADATSDSIPLAGGSFDASQIILNLVTGNTAYNLLVLGSPVTGSFDTNFPVFNSLSGGTLTLAGGVYTVTIPILGMGTFDVEGATLVDVYAGQIVATATVPEPAGLALAALGIVGLLSRWGSRAKERNRSGKAKRASGRGG